MLILGFLILRVILIPTLSHTLHTPLYSGLHNFSFSFVLCSVCMNHGRKCVSLLHKSVRNDIFTEFIPVHGSYEGENLARKTSTTTLNRWYKCYLGVYESKRSYGSLLEESNLLPNSDFEKIDFNIKHLINLNKKFDKKFQITSRNSAISDTFFKFLTILCRKNASNWF